LIYLQTLKLPQHLSRDDRRRIRHQAKNYLIIDDTLYHRGVDNILHHCLNHEEVEFFSMTVTVGHVVVIYLGLRQPKIYCEPVIFGHQFLKIALKWSRSVTLARCSLRKCAHTQPLFTQSSPSVPSPSGGYILWTVTQPRLGGTNILSWSWIILLNGKRPCLPLNLMVRLQHSSYSTRL
jgi:hypothetical protein